MLVVNATVRCLREAELLPGDVDLLEGLRCAVAREVPLAHRGI